MVMVQDAPQNGRRPVHRIAMPALAFLVVLAVAFASCVLQVLATSTHTISYSAALSRSVVRVVPHGRAYPGSGALAYDGITTMPMHQRSSLRYGPGPSVISDPGAALLWAVRVAAAHTYEPGAWSRLKARTLLVRGAEDPCGVFSDRPFATSQPSVYGTLGRAPVTASSGATTSTVSSDRRTCGAPFHWSRDSVLEFLLAFIAHTGRWCWESTPILYAIWHVSVVGCWRLFRSMCIASISPGVDAARSAAPPLWKHLLVSCAVTMLIPTLAESVFGLWYGATRAYAQLHSDGAAADGFFASIGPFGYWGTWCGAVLLHAIGVHVTGGGPRRAVFWAVLTAAVTAFNTPIVLGWIGRIVPTPWLEHYVPY